MIDKAEVSNKQFRREPSAIFELRRENMRMLSRDVMIGEKTIAFSLAQGHEVGLVPLCRRIPEQETNTGIRQLEEYI